MCAIYEIVLQFRRVRRTRRTISRSALIRAASRSVSLWCVEYDGTLRFGRRSENVVRWIRVFPRCCRLFARQRRVFVRRFGDFSRQPRESARRSGVFARRFRVFCRKLRPSKRRLRTYARLAQTIPRRWRLTALSCLIRTPDALGAPFR